MILKFPQILSYTEWHDLYELPDTPDFKRRQEHRASREGELFDDAKPFVETEELKNLRKDILTTMEKHVAAFEEVEEKMVKYLQEYTLQDPPVYLANLRDSRNREEDTFNLTAKTFWPLMGDRKKEIRIYIGKANEYPDHKTDYVRRIAKQKMKEHLLERRRNNEI